MGHSSLPWDVHRSGEVVDAHGEFVASIEGEVETPHDDDNRKLIVTAVNHHAKLVAALTSLLDDLTDAGEDANPETGEVYDSVANAREALAAAKGEA